MVADLVEMKVTIESSQIIYKVILAYVSELTVLDLRKLIDYLQDIYRERRRKAN